MVNTLRYLKLLLNTLPFLAASAAFAALPDTQLPRSSLALISESASADQEELEFKATPLMAQETRFLVELLERVHYSGPEVKKGDFTRLLTDFMAELDPQKLFFLAGDRDEILARHGGVLQYNLISLGRVDAAFDIYNIYRQRARERIEWIFNELEAEIDFNRNESFLADRREGNWPADRAEADDLWRKRLKSDLLEEVLNDKTLTEARQKVHSRYERTLRNNDDVEASDLHEWFLTTLTRMYDPHSSFFSADTFEDFSISMRLSLVGIGTLLADEDGTCVVKEVIPGGPASLSKQIRPNDKIVAVGSGEGEPVDIVGMKLRKIVDLIRGKKGTEVHLTLIPADASDSSVRKEVVLVRDLVKLNASRASASVYEVPSGDQTASIGVIELPSFYGDSEDPSEGGERTSATSDVEELITKLQAQGVDGVVLDLRHNGGGLLSEAVSLTGLFIDQGPVVQIRDSNGFVNVRPDSDPRVSYQGPLAVLVSRFSASASEIVAGALQNYGRAVVVGDSSTHGKGTVQNVLALRDFIVGARSLPKTGAAKLTVQKFYLPNGSSTQMRGVVPDVVLPSVEDLLPIGEADLKEALSWDYIPATRFRGQPLDSRIISPLRAASETRQATLEEFGYLREHIEWYRARQERIKEVSLNLEERQRQKAEDDAYRKKLKAEVEALAGMNFPSKEVELDAIALATVTGPEGSPTAAAKDRSEEDAEGMLTLGTGSAFDVHLREALRILADALDLSKDRSLWAEDGHAPLTASVTNAARNF